MSDVHRDDGEPAEGAAAEEVDAAGEALDAVALTQKPKKKPKNPRKRPARIQCDLCDMTFAPQAKFRHRNSPKCLARQDSMEMRALGLHHVFHTVRPLLEKHGLPYRLFISCVDRGFKGKYASFEHCVAVAPEIAALLRFEQQAESFLGPVKSSLRVQLIFAERAIQTYKAAHADQTPQHRPRDRRH